MDFFQTFFKTNIFITRIRDLNIKRFVFLKKVRKKSIAALHRLTQDVQHSTGYPKTHVGGPDLDVKNKLLIPCQSKQRKNREN